MERKGGRKGEGEKGREEAQLPRKTISGAATAYLLTIGAGY